MTSHKSESVPDTLIDKLLRDESTGGILLVIIAVIAILLANSPFSHLYESFLNVPVQVRIAELNLEKPLVLWINDGLMAIFFFLIGLEIKREVMIGHLSQPSLVVLPAIAAVAGILAPAMIYAWFNYGNEVAIRGWAIPSATDIAFALGVFSLFKTRVPISLKLFLLSVAIFDDLGAIIIIAIFYSSDLSIASLAVAAAGILVLGLLNYLNVRRQAAYLLMGLVIWIAVLKSGVHATLAGFAIALFIPLSLKNEDGHPMLPHLEHTLHPWVAFLILPLFAFANAGVNLEGVNWDVLSNSVTLGIALGLIIGKQLGIFAVCALVIKLGWAKLPEGASWLQFYAVSILCGIGFTMSLFIGTLAFEGLPAEYLTQVKLG
ncbi:MAG: Na+/H+ antiporter NhaA, partial [Oleispira sp.]|nr:Na+/H+ antiporter NhaA [Oleispira sp.]